MAKSPSYLALITAIAVDEPRDGFYCSSQIPQPSDADLAVLLSEAPELMAELQDERLGDAVAAVLASNSSNKNACIGAAVLVVLRDAARKALLSDVITECEWRALQRSIARGTYVVPERLAADRAGVSLTGEIP